MKETDFAVICSNADRQLNEADYTLPELVGQATAVLVVANIYQMSDQICGFAQDFKGVISLIASPTRISVILPEGQSFIKANGDICDYDDLDDDIKNIITLIQAAIDRVYSGV